MKSKFSNTAFRLTFDEHCNDLFSKYGVCDTSTDLEERDRNCLYLAYAYVMIQVSSRSVMTSMMNKLIIRSRILSDLNH